MHFVPEWLDQIFCFVVLFLLVRSGKFVRWGNAMGFVYTCVNADYYTTKIQLETYTSRHFLLFDVCFRFDHPRPLPFECCDESPHEFFCAVESTDKSYLTFDLVHSHGVQFLNMLKSKNFAKIEKVFCVTPGRIR